MKKEDITKEVIVAYLNDNWDEDGLTSKLDDEIMNWVDSDWEDDGEYESEYDWYMDFGHGEAEDVVRKDIYDTVLNEFNLTLDEYSEIIGEDAWDTVNEVFPNLDK